MWIYMKKDLLFSARDLPGAPAQNHRMVWVKRDLKDHQGHLLLQPHPGMPTLGTAGINKKPNELSYLTRTHLCVCLLQNSVK